MKLIIKFKRDIILYGVIAALFIISLAAWYFMSEAEPENAAAEIYADGKLFKTVELSKTGRQEHLSFSVFSDGGKCEILVKNGEIGIVSADCPDKICVNTGFVSGGFIPVVCLPNGVLIKVVNGENYGEFDAVAW